MFSYHDRRVLKTLFLRKNRAFLRKYLTAAIYLQETRTRVFSHEYCKKIFEQVFYRTPPVAAFSSVKTIYYMPTIFLFYVILITIINI